MPASPFVDHYRILEVKPSASAKEIRRAFRRLVLLAHPDKNPHRRDWSERRIRELIRAFETIGDEKKRRAFDLQYRQRNPDALALDESQLFFFRKSDPGACALRILYFLLHGRGREAIPLLRRMEREEGPGFLVGELDRDDYLDCLFLLGEYHLGRREYVEAFRRLRTFYVHERKARNRRHYFDAVIALLKDLYLRKLPHLLPPEDALRHLKEAAAELELGRRDRGMLARRMEEVRDRAAKRSAASPSA